MADQAEYFRCSVSRISAVERGEEEIPPDFPDQFIYWLQFTDEEKRKQVTDGESHPQITDEEIVQLRDLAQQKKKRKAAAGAIKRELETAKEQFRQMRSLLNATGSSRGFSRGDLSKIASCARACFGLGSQLTFDTVQILENRIPEIDPEFYLEVKHNHDLQSQIAGIAKTFKSQIKTVVLSEYVYKAAHRQKCDARFITAHEIGHWVLNQGGNFQTYPSFLQIEKDVDCFTREFLMPPDIAQRFNSPRQLALICNVPIEQAEIRMSELGLWPTRQEHERVSKGFSKLLSELREKPETAPNKPASEFKLIPFPNAYNKNDSASFQKPRPKKIAIKNLPLFEYAELKARPDYYAMLDVLAKLSGVQQDEEEEEE